MVPVEGPAVKVAGVADELRPREQDLGITVRLQVLHERDMGVVPCDRHQFASGPAVPIGDGVQFFGCLGCGVAMHLDRRVDPLLVGLLDERYRHRGGLLYGREVITKLAIDDLGTRLVLRLQQLSKFLRVRRGADAAKTKSVFRGQLLVLGLAARGDRVEARFGDGAEFFGKRPLSVPGGMLDQRPEICGQDHAGGCAGGGFHVLFLVNGTLWRVFNDSKAAAMTRIEIMAERDGLSGSALPATASRKAACSSR